MPTSASARLHDPGRSTQPIGPDAEWWEQLHRRLKLEHAWDDDEPRDAFEMLDELAAELQAGY
jgi:hypothetical protein